MQAGVYFTAGTEGGPGSGISRGGAPIGFQRIICAAGVGLDVLHSAFVTVFLCLAGVILAVWLGAGWPGMIVGGVLGSFAGVAISKRVFFGKPSPVLEAPPAEWRLPGIQDEFERRFARQRVLGALLIASLVALCAVRIAAEQDWPALFGIPREVLLKGALLVVAVVLPLGLLNWRCPSCRRSLGGSLSIRQCPRCGVALRG